MIHNEKLMTLKIVENSWSHVPPSFLRCCVITVPVDRVDGAYR